MSKKLCSFVVLGWFITSTVYAETNLSPLAGWSFWCRIAETGEKVSLSIPANPALRTKALLIVSKPNSDGIQDIAVLKQSANTFKYKFTLRSNQDGIDAIEFIGIDLGREGSISIQAPGAIGQIGDATTNQAQLKSNLAQLNYPNGQNLQYCTTFFEANPKPIATGGN